MQKRKKIIINLKFFKNQFYKYVSNNKKKGYLMIFTSEVDKIPLFGLDQTTHVILLMIIGFVGSILAVYIFPRIFSRLFLKVKSKIRWKYKDAYLEYTPRPLTLYKFGFRAIYLFLLELGILVLIIPFIDPSLFLTERFGLDYYEGELGVPAVYTVGVLLGLIFLTVPFVVGIWSVGWAMEDAGLMHYKFDNKAGRELYEIEPIHVNYTNYLKGYAGISSILFLIQAALTWASVTSEVRISDVIITLLLPAFIILISIPAYIIYSKTTAKKDFLRANLKKLKKLTEADVLTLN
jgi:hypothetical protein